MKSKKIFLSLVTLLCAQLCTQFLHADDSTTCSILAQAGSSLTLPHNICALSMNCSVSNFANVDSSGALLSNDDALADDQLDTFFKNMSSDMKIYLHYIDAADSYGTSMLQSSDAYIANDNGTVKIYGTKDGTLKYAKVLCSKATATYNGWQQSYVTQLVSSGSLGYYLPFSQRLFLKIKTKTTNIDQCGGGATVHLESDSQRDPYDLTGDDTLGACGYRGSSIIFPDDLYLVVWHHN